MTLRRLNLTAESLMAGTAVSGLAQVRKTKRRRALKRVIDIVGSSLMILLFSPLILLVWLLILVIDGGPVIYRRRVVGTGGEFDAFKFRTMNRDADATLASDPRLRAAFSQNFKLKRDPRVTRLGFWLRKYSADELPQLWNVFQGQMSLVGPRMITTTELQKYGPYQELLRTVKPGLTGYWQVRYRCNATTSFES